MDKDKLKQLIIEHKEYFLRSVKLIKREGQEIIRSYIDQKEVVIISGVRRAGKSSLMKLICDDLIKKNNIPINNILYLNFDDERFIEFNHTDFEVLLETYIELYQPKDKKYFFLDEIQNIKGWERWVNRIYEFEDIKIFVSGSNSTLLSSEIATALTGRNRQFETFPFSFREFLDLKKHKYSDTDFFHRENKIKLKNYFKEYVRKGGFPEVLKNNDTSLLQQYFKDIIYRDVIARYNIRNIKEIKELALFLSSNFGTIQSYKKLNELINGGSFNTIKNYLEILEQVYLFFRLNMFDYSVRKQIYNPSKVYTVDVALANSIAFKFSQNIGRTYENIVFLELLRRNPELYYWKSKKGNEVDFLVKKGLEIDQAIQVSAKLTDKNTKQREIKGLINASRELNVHNLYILTEDEQGEETIDNIKINIIPLWKWLLLK